MKAHRHSEIAAAQVTLCDPWQLGVKPTSTQPPTSRSPVQRRCASISPSFCLLFHFIPPQTKHLRKSSRSRACSGGGGGVRGTSDFSRRRSHPLFPRPPSPHHTTPTSVSFQNSALDRRDLGDPSFGGGRSDVCEPGSRTYTPWRGDYEAILWVVVGTGGSQCWEMRVMRCLR